MEVLERTVNWLVVQTVAMHQHLQLADLDSQLVMQLAYPLSLSSTPTTWINSQPQRLALKSFLYFLSWWIFFFYTDYLSYYYITLIFIIKYINSTNITLYLQSDIHNLNLHCYIKFMKYMPRQITLIDKGCLCSTRVSQERKTYK